MGADLWSSFVQILYSFSELILFDSDLELNSSDFLCFTPFFHLSLIGTEVLIKDMNSLS